MRAGSGHLAGAGQKAGRGGVGWGWKAQGAEAGTALRRQKRRCPDRHEADRGTKDTGKRWSYFTNILPNINN